MKFLKTRLAIMMFIQYVIWGAWYVTITTYLTQTLHFTGTQAGLIFSTVSLASLVSPFFVGLVADRFFATERVMAFLYLVSAALLFMVTKVTTFSGVFWVMLMFCLAYFPTVGLTNSITMQSVKDPGRDFPPIRVLGTLGFIVAVSFVSLNKLEANSGQFLVAAAAAVRHGDLQHHLAAAHAAPRTRSESDLAARDRARHAEHDEADQLHDLHHRVDSRLHSAHLLLFVRERLPERPAGAERGIHHDARPVGGGRDAAGDAHALQVRQHPRRAAARPGVVDAPLLLLAYGNADAGIWMFYFAILLHGNCYDFFFVAGQLYTDQEAPAHLRSSAQGFIAFVTYGVGMYMGSVLSGVARDYFPTWQSFWLSSAIMSAAIMFLVLFFFRSRTMIRAKDKGLPGAEPATVPGADERRSSR